MSTPDRGAMLERGHPEISIRAQCRPLGIGRSGVYRPAPANDDEDLALMRRIDALFTAWPFLGQRLHRTAVAVSEVRGRLSQGLRGRPRGARRDCRVNRLLQRPEASSGAGRPNPDGGVACGRQRRASRQRRRHDAALARRCRVAHMPTATTATDALRGVIKEVGAGQPSNQERWSIGPADGVRLRLSLPFDGCDQSLRRVNV
jgi:hypothetical protein